MKNFGKLCVITDTVIQKKYNHVELAEIAVKGGADIIQLRDKITPAAELIDIAVKIKKICDKNNVIFIINDRTDAALISEADGVHLGKEDIPVNEARKLLGKNKIIGATAHSLSEALKAEKDGADYIGFGHIYPTYSKIKSSKPKGTSELRKVCNAVNIPVFAIGGINAGNAKEVLKAGAYGIAVIGSVVKSRSPGKAVKELRKLIYG